MEASLNSDTEHWAVSDSTSLLRFVTDVALLRLANDKTAGCGLEEVWAEQLGLQTPRLKITFPSGAALRAFEALPEITLGTLVRTCRLNYETTDETSVAHREIMSRSTAKNKSLWAYVLSDVPAGDYDLFSIFTTNFCF